MDAKAKALQAAGRPVVSYAAGEPDFPTAAVIVDAAAAALQDPKNFRYTPAAGLPDLREAIAAKTLGDSGLAVDALADRGDQRRQAGCLPGLPGRGEPGRRGAPAGPLLDHLLRRRSRSPTAFPVEVFAGAEQDYKVTVEQLEAARDAPHDDAGVRVAVEPDRCGVHARGDEGDRPSGPSSNGVWIITDEIYQNLVYEGHEGRLDRRGRPGCRRPDDPRQRRREDLRHDRMACRAGWSGPQDAIKLAANLQSHLSRNVNNVAQRAALAALTGPQDEAGGYARQAFDRRRRLDRVRSWRRSTASRCRTRSGPSTPTPDVRGLLGRTWRGVTPTTTARARRPHPRAGRGRRGARRGVRPEGLPPASLTHWATNNSSRAPRRLQELFA